MLVVIDCPNCDIRFTPECEACPKCHDFVPPLSARKPYLERKAKEFADYNASKSDVRDYLMDSGLADFDADEILRAAFRKSAAENRLFAVKQIFGGGSLALIGGIGCFTPAILYAGGLMIAGLGVFAIGVYSLFTGKA